MDVPDKSSRSTGPGSDQATVPPGSSGSQVRLTGVGKAYRSGTARFPALCGVDLNIAYGEYVALMGPSGCGKSTLLHVVGGIERADHGEVLVAGNDLTTLGERRLAALRRKSIGIVFQFFYLLDHLRVRENIELPALLAGVAPGESRARAMMLAERLGIGTLLRRRPAQLSGGERQRVALARALVNDPAVLLADEPTGSLDEASASAVLDLLDSVHRQGQTVLLATHDPMVADRAERIVRLRAGRIESGSGGAAV